MTRPARLDAPPLFQLDQVSGPLLRLNSDTGAVVYIFILEPEIMRVMVLPDGDIRHPRTWVIAPGADDVAVNGRDRFDVTGFSCPAYHIDQSRDDYLVLSTKSLRLTIRLLNFYCRWEQKHGDDWIDIAKDRPTQAYDFGWWGNDQVRHYLARSVDERYFGLGERSGPMDRQGRRFRMNNLDCMGYDAQTSDPLYKHVPFYITHSTKTRAAFGIYYDTLSDCTFDFGSEHSNYNGLYRLFEADHGDLDYYVLAGPAIADVTQRFTWLTGRPAAMPDWALGYSGSTMSYTDAPDAQDKMAGFLADVRRHDIPCSSFHLSSGYTSIGTKRYVFNWNYDKFPDPKAFAQSYNDAGVRLIANIKPALLLDHPAFDQAAKAGLFLSDETGQVIAEQFWDAPGAYLDFTNPKTRDWWQENVTTQLLRVGIKATWNDNNEFEVTNPRSLAHGNGIPFAAIEMKPLQTLLMVRTSRQAQVAHAPDETPFLVSRAGFAGMQRYVQTWSGDNYTSWATLKWNLRMGLGLSLSGISNIGHDIGGFAGPKPDADLFLRWIACGIFMPRFSIHSWNDDGSVNEPWMYPDLMDDVRALFGLRLALIPYLKKLLADYRAHYRPVMRPVFYDFPEAPDCFAERDDFMLGADLLVAPVVEPDAISRRVDLPQGTDWVDGWTSERHAGGTSVICQAPYNRPPHFWRRGADFKPLT
jgi:alpha-glucosidase